MIARIIYLLFWIWQLPQNILGFLLVREERQHIGPAGFKYHYVPKWWIPCVCLGEYLFVSTPGLTRFAYGRGVLSVIFGPLYLFVIAIPSFLVLVIGRNEYYYLGFYATRWAMKLGSRKPYK